MRVIFFGTSAFAVPSLEQTAASAHQVVLCVTQPDRTQGRGLKPAPSPVKTAALRLGLPLAQPERLAPGEFSSLGADVGVVAAYGKILKPEMLALPPQGMLGVHPSLLPKYRGAAPIAWAVLNGDAITGTTIFRLEAGLDSGPVLAQEKMSIHPEEDAEELGRRLAAASARLLVRSLDELAAGRAVFTPQDATQATHAPKLSKEQGRIDWTAPAATLEQLVRGAAPWPGAATSWQGQPLKICRVRRGAEARSQGGLASALRGPGSPGAALPGTVLRVEDGVLTVATGYGTLEIVEVQPAGRRRMSVKEFLAGRKIAVGERLGNG